MLAGALATKPNLPTQTASTTQPYTLTTGVTPSVSLSTATSSITTSLFSSTVTESSPSSIYTSTTTPTDSTSTQSTSTFTSTASSSSTITSTSRATTTTTSSTTTASSTQPGTTQIILPDGVADNELLNFQPAKIVVVIGVNNTIVWTNEDYVQHTVKSVSYPSGGTTWDSGILNEGQGFTVTITVPGNYKYVCTIHPDWMVGTIKVVA